MNQEEQNSFMPLGPVNGDPLSTKQAAKAYLEKVAEESVQLTDSQKLIISQFIDMTSKGFVGSMPMLCKGAHCPFISACPISKVKATLPLNKPCPVENSIVALWVTKHLKSLGIENMEDPMYSFDMDMLYELAGQELIRWRCSVHLAKNPDLVSTQQVSATVQGEPIFAEVINPILDVMERAGRNISKIREALVATREAQVRAGQVTVDPTQRAATLRAEAEKLMQDRKKKQEVIKDAQFEVKDE